MQLCDRHIVTFRRFSTMDLNFGATFDSFQNFEAALSRYEDSHYVVFVRSACIKLKYSRRSKITQEIVDRFKFKRLKYVCKFYGKPKPRGENIRKTSSYKCDCEAYFILNFIKDKNELTIQQMNAEHINHVLSESNYMSLPRQRRACLEDSRDYLKEVLAVNPNNRLLQSQVN